MVCVMVSGHQEYLADFLASTVSASIQILKNIRTVSPISYVQSLRTRLGGSIQWDSLAPPHSAATYDMLCK